MPTEALRRGLRSIARGGAGVLCDYGGTRGLDDLRRLVITRLAQEGSAVPPEAVMLTGSGTDAIDLLCRLLLKPGDTVLVDDPCYFNFRALLSAHQARVVGVAMTPTGPDPQAFEAVVDAERPRLYVTNAAIHNPTGATLSPQTAFRILKVATASGMIVVEDDVFADFEADPSPRLTTLDGLDRVIRIGSFSKTVSASLRCGYIAARPEWIEALVDLQVAVRFGGPSPLATELLASVLGAGGYRRHLAVLRTRLAAARTDLRERLARLDMETWTQPRGGFYLWCRLPGGLDSAAVAKAAMREAVILAPGNVFSVSQSAGAFLRFNVAQSTDRRLDAVLGRAMARAAVS